MESGALFLIFLLIFIFFVVIVIAAFPCTQQAWKKYKGSPGCYKPPGPIHRRNVFATALLSQKNATVIPELSILTTPTPIEFNQPDTNIVVPKTATYEVNYSVQLKWLQEATVSTKITSNDGNIVDLLGSQIQQTVMSGVLTVSHTFLASLKKGMILTLVSQSSLVTSIVVPASDDPSIIFTPTTLASIALVEI